MLRTGLNQYTTAGGASFTYDDVLACLPLRYLRAFLCPIASLLEGGSDHPEQVMRIGVFDIDVYDVA